MDLSFKKKSIPSLADPLTQLLYAIAHAGPPRSDTKASVRGSWWSDGHPGCDQGDLIE